MNPEDGYNLRLYVAGHTPKSLGRYRKSEKDLRGTPCWQIRNRNRRLNGKSGVGPAPSDHRHPDTYSATARTTQAHHRRFIQSGKGAGRPRYSTKLKGTSMADVVQSKEQPKHFQDADQVIHDSIMGTLTHLW